MTVTVEGLSSNVVNYLVWRYLQEAGYGNAASQLARCWNREPDTLPFARNVEQHALISLLQDGLWFDKLQAEASNGQQRYHFGSDHGRPYSVRNGNLLTLDQGIPAYQLAEDPNGAVQEPPPKKSHVKKRKGPRANGIDPQMTNQINGDAMDIDQNGHTHVTNSVRADSEAMASDAESPTVAELPISTLSIGQSTEIQTEQPADLAPNTLFACSINEEDKEVHQTLWGTPGAPLLVAAGKSLLRLYHIPEDNRSRAFMDLKVPLNSNFSITALCWNSHGEITVSAQEERTNEIGEIMKSNKLFKILDAGSECRVVSSTAGLVTTLRWNESKQLLLAVSSDGLKGSVKIWRDSDDDGDIQLPAWTTFTERTIVDAVWIGDMSFVICGTELFEIYEIGESPSLSPQRTMETDISWDCVKYDASSGIIAALGMIKAEEPQEGDDLPPKSFLGIVHPSNPTELQTQEYPDEYFTDLDFRPRPRYNSDSLGISAPYPPTPPSPVMLATCAASGVARVWDANEPFRCLKRIPIADENSANNIAFSPNGALLAAAGPDAVTIWDLDKRDMPVAIWRAQDFANGEWDSSVENFFNLGWDPDSSRLSIALGNQIAVIPVQNNLFIR